MKTVIKTLLILLVFFVASCRDTKKDEANTKAVEEVDAIEVETDSITQDLDKEAKDLQKELDKLETEN